TATAGMTSARRRNEVARMLSSFLLSDDGDGTPVDSRFAVRPATVHPTKSTSTETTMARPSVDVYWLPYCTTCQKTVQYLHDHEVPIGSFRDLKAQPLEAAEVRDLARKVGGVDRLFSKRAMKYRQLGLHEKELSEDEMVRWMADEYTFVTRPVIVRGDRATAGFSAKKIDELIGA
ncbi:MAG TPA: ArsC/Spx/MgsR family protein, partial [Longimicrobium sp.]|nr:ArsC/Spx/MgsR family protein [Longimicrobium sp.]